jgi:hypothetical protein
MALALAPVKWAPRYHTGVAAVYRGVVTPRGLR